MSRPVLISHATNTALNVTLNESIAELGLPTLRYTVSISGSPASATTTTNTTGTVWDAVLSPLTVTVRLCATTAADCTISAGRTLDLSTTIDAGRVEAQVIKGFG